MLNQTTNRCKDGERGLGGVVKLPGFVNHSLAVVADVAVVAAFEGRGARGRQRERKLELVGASL